MLTLTLMAMLGTAPSVTDAPRSVALMGVESLEAERDAMKWKRNPLFTIVPVTLMVGGPMLFLYASMLGYSMSWFSGDSWTYRPERAPLMGLGVGIGIAGVVGLIAGIVLRSTIRHRWDEVTDELERRESLDDEREAPAPGSRLPPVPNLVGATVLQF